MKAFFDTTLGARIPVNVPWLHQLVVRMPPVVPKPTPEAAVFTFNWLSATGTGLLLASIISGLALGLGPRRLVTRKSLENACAAVAATGGSTNAGLHIPAIAHEAGTDYARILAAIKTDYPRAKDLPTPGFAAGPCLLKDTMQLAAFNNNAFTLRFHCEYQKVPEPVPPLQDVEIRRIVEAMTMAPPPPEKPKRFKIPWTLILLIILAMDGLLE